jgi:hypothetical protein
MERSESIGQLAQALAKAQKSYKPLKKESTNPYFNSKYADLAAVLESTKDALADNNLAVIQLSSYVDNKAVVRTVLAHESGEFILEDLALPNKKDDAQGIGSSLTYGRRYAYSSIVGVSADSDDDGAGATSGKSPENPTPKALPKVNQIPAKGKDNPRPAEEKKVEAKPQPAPAQEPAKEVAKQEEADPKPDKQEWAAIQLRVRDLVEASNGQGEVLRNFIKRTAGTQDAKSVTKKQWDEILKQLDTSLAEGKLTELITKETA